MTSITLHLMHLKALPATISLSWLGCASVSGMTLFAVFIDAIFFLSSSFVKWADKQLPIASSAMLDLPALDIKIGLIFDS